MAKSLSMIARRTATTVEMRMMMNPEGEGGEVAGSPAGGCPPLIRLLHLGTCLPLRMSVRSLKHWLGNSKRKQNDRTHRNPNACQLRNASVLLAPDNSNNSLPMVAITPTRRRNKLRKESAVSWPPLDLATTAGLL